MNNNDLKELSKKLKQNNIEYENEINRLKNEQVKSNDDKDSTNISIKQLEHIIKENEKLIDILNFD